MINGHGGNIYELATELGCEPVDIYDMSSNVNPIGPPPGLTDFLRDRLDEITALPEVDARTAVESFARRWDIDPRRVLAANGTTQFIYTLPQALKPLKTLIFGPTYADYADACVMYHVPHAFVQATDATDFNHDLKAAAPAIDTADLVFICNPNNPTGTLIESPKLKALCESFPNTCFAIDESYLPFAPDRARYTMIHCGLANVVVLNSMSKIFRLPGLRIGFLIGSPDIIRNIESFALPWSANSLAQAAVRFLMEHRGETDAFIDRSRELIAAERGKFVDSLAGTTGIHFFPSVTSFVLGRLADGLTSDVVWKQMARQRLLIRNCANFPGLSNRYIRISMKTPEINRMAAERLVQVLGGEQD